MQQMKKGEEAKIEAIAIGMRRDVFSGMDMYEGEIVRNILERWLR